MVTLLAAKRGCPLSSVVHVLNEAGQSPLSIVATRGRYSVLWQQEKEEDGDAIVEQQLTCARLLLDSFGADVEGGAYGRMMAEGDTRAAPRLVDAAVQPPLWWACNSSSVGRTHPQMISLLLSYGSRPTPGVIEQLATMPSSTAPWNLDYRRFAERELQRRRECLRRILTESQHPLQVPGVALQLSLSHHGAAPVDSNLASALLKAGTSPFASYSTPYETFMLRHYESFKDAAYESPCFLARLAGDFSGNFSGTLEAFKEILDVIQHTSGAGSLRARLQTPGICGQLASSLQRYCGDGEREPQLIERIAMLLQLGLPLDAQGRDGNTLLATAIVKRRPNLAAWLIERGANLHQLALGPWEDKAVAAPLRIWRADPLKAQQPTLLQLVAAVDGPRRPTWRGPEAQLPAEHVYAVTRHLTRLLLDGGALPQLESGRGLSLLGLISALVRGSASGGATARCCYGQGAGMETAERPSLY